MPTLRDVGIVGLIHGSKSASFRALNAHLLVPKGPSVTVEPQKPSKPSKSKGKAVSGAPRANKPRASRVERTRNAATLSEAAYWGFVRSTLRRAFRFWKPAIKALHAARVPMSGPRGRKWGYVCAACGKVYLRSQVQIDHKEPAGALTDYAHVGDFLRRLTPEDPAAYQVLCTGEGTQRCHEAKTATDKKNRDDSLFCCKV